MNAIKAKEGECSQSRCVHLYADEELDASHVLEMETHLEACGGCRDELATIRAFRRSLKSSTARRAPRGLRDRLQASVVEACGETMDPGVSHVAARQTTETESDFSRAASNRRVRWIGYAAACVAAAASFVIAIWFQRQKDDNRTASQVSGAVPVKGSLFRALASALPANDVPRSEALDTIIDQLVSLHAHPLPPEIKKLDELETFEPYVGVPVRRPTFRIENSSARLLISDASLVGKPKDDRGSAEMQGKLKFVGARLHAMQDMQRAALLTYVFDGHRITVYVFDPRSVPLRKTRLRPTVVRERPVYVGNLRGYSVAAAEKSGVGYAVASDFDDTESARMVANF